MPSAETRGCLRLAVSEAQSYVPIIYEMELSTQAKLVHAPKDVVNGDVCVGAFVPGNIYSVDATVRLVRALGRVVRLYWRDAAARRVGVVDGRHWACRCACFCVVEVVGKGAEACVHRIDGSDVFIL